MFHTFQDSIRIDPAWSCVNAGSDGSTSVVFDMLGYDGIAAAVNFTAVTTGASLTLYAEQSTASNGTFVSCYQSCASFASTQGSSSLWLFSEVYKPTKRYVRFMAERASQNITIYGGLAFRYRAHETPVAESTSTGGSSMGFVDYAICYTGSSS